MGDYRDLVITSAGLDLIAQSVAGDCTIHFKQMLAGAGSYAEADKAEAKLKAMTELRALRQQVDLSGISRDDGAVSLRAVFSNKDLTETYSMTEIGLTASDGTSDPVLFAIAAADTADVMVKYNGRVEDTIVETMTLVISDQATVTLAGSTNVYATSEDLSNLQKKVEEKQAEAKKVTASLPLANWAETTEDDATIYTQIAAASGVTTDNLIIVSPAPASTKDYGGVYAAEQSAGNILFKTEELPEADLTVNVAIFD